MAKKGKLLAALDAHRGRDYEQERQKKLAKEARKRQASNSETSQLAQTSPRSKDAAKANGTKTKFTAEISAEELSESENDDSGVALGDVVDDLSSEEEEEEDSGDDDDELDEGEEDIPMSDLEDLDPEDREDVIPHQRLTINNTAALLQAHKSFALAPSLPFFTTQAVTSAAQIEVPDVDDDLQREMAFYKQCLSAAVEGRMRLKKEGVPFTRPNDYFAEMVKTDEHMGRIKARLIEQAANKKAAAEARKQRDLKKFGKQVQVAKEQERAREKRDALDRISQLKRKRKDAAAAGGATNINEDEDMFDVAVDNELRSGSGRGGSGSGNTRTKGAKRTQKDAKFGFGGKKRHAKSNDAASTGDIRRFSVGRMKSGGGGPGAAGSKRGKAPRPGKSKRARTS